MKKFITRAAAAQQIKDWQQAGKKVGYTSGVFDLLHLGHVTYLEQAKSSCDYLVVAVNSDSSVRSYKGPLRPILPEDERASLVAALSMVDLVFVFSESNNNENISILKPDVYYKAGDYSKEKLSSAKIIESYGGRVEILPFVAGRSTSRVIEQILVSEQAQLGEQVDLNQQPQTKKPAIFLDRDGTIIKHIEYLSEPEKVELLAGALEGLQKLKQLGYWLIIVTNQPGIGIGYLSKEDFYRVNLQLFKFVSAAGVLFDKIYFCPHSKSEQCQCRKPEVGMLERAQQELPIDLANSYVIGDSTADIQLAKNAGCGSILVNTGYAGKDGLYQVKADFDVGNLLVAAELLEQSE